MDPRLGLLLPGVDMMIFGTKPDLGPAVAALVSSKSSSSKLAKLGCDEPCVCPWVDAAADAAARGAGGVWCVRPEWGADRAFSLKPPLDEEFEFQSDDRAGAVARGMLPPRAWSDDMPPYLFWLAMALSRTSAMAVGSLRSCGEEEAGAVRRVREILKMWSGDRKTGCGAVGSRSRAFRAGWAAISPWNVACTRVHDCGAP